MTGTGGLQRIPRSFIENYKIPLPPIKVQHKIVEQIEKEQSLVNANKELVAIYEQKIKEEINKLWQGDSADNTPAKKKKELSTVK